MTRDNINEILVAINIVIGTFAVVCGNWMGLVNYGVAAYIWFSPRHE